MPIVTRAAAPMRSGICSSTSFLEPRTFAGSHLNFTTVTSIEWAATRALSEKSRGPERYGSDAIELRMSLGDFQRALADLVANPAMCLAVRRHGSDALN